MIFLFPCRICLLFVCLFFCFTSQSTSMVMGVVSSPNHTFSWASLNKHGSFGNGKTEFQDFFRTIPGLFFIFQGLNFFPILYNQRGKKCTYFSRKRQNEMAHSISLILTPVIKPGLPHKLNRIEYKAHLNLCRVSSDFHSVFVSFMQFFLRIS